MKVDLDTREKKLVMVRNEAEFFDFIEQKLAQAGYELFETSSMVPSKVAKTNKGRLCV